MRSWDRASFEFNTHPPKPKRRVTQRDFLVPLHRYRLKLLGVCATCGVCIAVTHVYTVAFMVGVMTNRSLGAWLWGSMLAVSLVSTVGLFVWSLRRERHYLQNT